MFHMVGKTKQLRSDSAGVEFVTEGEVVTCLNVRGTFPYTSIVPKLAEERKTDSNGNITETYVIEAEISLNTKNTMKLYFERLEDLYSEICGQRYNHFKRKGGGMKK